MQSLKFIIPAIIIFVLAISGIYYLYQTQTSSPSSVLNPNASASPIGTTFPQASASAQPSSEPRAMGVNSQPATGPEDNQVRNPGITVLGPSRDSKISSATKVYGIANVTSQTVIIEVRDAHGKLLGSGSAQACIGLDACPFSASVVFKNSETASGTILVYSPSQIDSSPTYTQELPVKF